MLHVAPDLSGVIPLNAFEAQAASVRDLAAGGLLAVLGVVLFSRIEKTFMDTV